MNIRQWPANHLCLGKLRLKRLGRPSGLTDRLLSGGINRFAHCLSKYCAEWLTSGNRCRKGNSGRTRVTIYGNGTFSSWDYNQ